MVQISVGQTYTAKNQGMSITPMSTKVTVVWVENGHVHYKRQHEVEVRQTPVDRFLEIVDLNATLL